MRLDNGIHGLMKLSIKILIKIFQMRLVLNDDYKQPVFGRNLGLTINNFLKEGYNWEMYQQQCL